MAVKRSACGQRSVMAANTRSAPRTSARKSCTSATRCASPPEPSGPPGALVVAPGAVAVLASTTRAYVVPERRATPNGRRGGRGATARLRLMRLLVLGGTVFLGRHLVAAAVGRGDQVTVLSRGRHGAPPPDGVTWLRGDRIEDLPRLTAGGCWDAVVDTSGYTAAQAEAAGHALRGRTAHYAFISTCNVHPAWPAEPVGEDSPVWEGGEGYGPDKARAERALEAAL